MIKKLRYFWWLAMGLVIKHRKTVLVAAGASILILVGVLKLHARTGFKLGTASTKIGMIGRYRVEELPPSITQKISAGLTIVSRNGSVTPGLAVYWEVSEDGTEYTFKIDKSAVWHDGDPVTAANLVVRIENVEVTVSDEETITFKLKEPFAPFPALLARPIFKEDLVGLSDWRVESLSRNGEFVDRLVLVDGKGAKVEYRFYLTTGDLITAFKLGEISQIVGLTSLDRVPDWEGLVIEPELHFDQYLAVFFNTGDANLQEKSFRQALAYAIEDKPQGERRALSPISPESWAYNPLVKPYEADPDLAAKQLASVVGDAEKPSLELVTTLPYLNRAEEIAEDWSRLGVATKVRVVTVIPQEFQVLLIGQQRPDDPDQYFLWHSIQETNITRFANPKIDKLLEDGRRTLDRQKRIEIYRDFQRFLLEECPAVFLEHITTYTVRRR